MGCIDKKGLLSAAYYYSYTRFTLNIFSLFEDINDADSCTYLREFAGVLTERADAFLAGNKNCSVLGKMRMEILGLLEQIKNYIACFGIYEYVMDRMERRFFDVAPLKTTPQVLADDLMDFVMDGDNNYEINHRIQAIIGELPVRFTKSKFYSVLEESLRPYLGRENKDLDRMIDMIRSAAALPLYDKTAADEIQPLFQKIHNTAMQMERCDYMSLTREGFEERKEDCDECYDELCCLLGQFILLPDLVNDLYVMELCSSYAEHSSYHTLLEKTLGAVLERIDKRNGSPETDSNAILALFRPLEGKQEYYWKQYFRISGKNDNTEEEKDEEIFIVEQLLSGNIGAPLEIEEGPQVTRQILSSSLEQLFTELEMRLKRTAKPASRAVMAKVLSEIPVWFNSLEEIEIYIRDSLEQCLDTAEKEACMVNLRQMMVEWDALV